MTSKTDIILARQRATLMHSIGELHRLLDEDDNWRALAALESVGEAAGGVAGYAWIARREELTASLAENPAYYLCKELEHALTVVSQHLGKPRAAVNTPVSQTESETASFGQAQRFTPAADIQDAPDSDEPRRSSIAERIATLAVPLATPAAVEAVVLPNLQIEAEELDLGASGSAEGHLDQEPVPTLDPQPDAVAMAAKRIVASLHVASPVVASPGSDEHSDAPDTETVQRQDVRDSLESEEVQEVQELEPPDISDAVAVALNSVSDGFSVSAMDPEVLNSDEDTSRVAAEMEEVGYLDGMSAPVAAISEADLDGRLAIDDNGDLDGLAASQEAFAVTPDNSENDQTGFSDQFISDEAFEAEVSIISKAQPISVSTPHIYPSALDKTDGDSGEEVSTFEYHETLEQRLQRLDRQSQTLIAPKSSEPTEGVEADEPSRANKWLEMIRARRAKSTGEPQIEARLYLSETASHQNELHDGSVETPKQSSIPIYDIYADGEFDPEGDIEAEVKIVQRRPADAVEARSRSQSPSSALASTARPPKIAREQPAEPAMPFGGEYEEASVEIIRQGSGAKSATIAPASSRAAKNRFIKTLTGE